MRRLLIGLFFSLGFFALQAQVQQGKLWVLIIGISDYEFIRPLTYADDDAMAFYQFVKENYGSQIDESEFGNVRILLNKQATGASITNAFKWLVTNAKENDRAIIYFSGHGGTEDLTIKKRGYLMGYDCFDKSYCNGGTLPLSYLNDILETLAFKNIRTLFVADACHAGKANEDDMTYLNTVLSGEMGSITKILSAQGQERSWESPKWGGGHGVFTYYLIQGLIGAADKDPVDNIVTLREINSYLDDFVPQETDYMQNPKIIGSNRNLRLSDVGAGKFLALQKEFGLKTQTTMLASKAPDSVLYIPENVIATYNELKKDIEEGNLPMAFNRYDELKSLTDIARVLQNAQGLLFSKSMDLSQKYINGFLQIDHYNSEIQEEHLLDYMGSLLKILPSDDKDRPEIEARQIFFEAEMLHWGYHYGKVKKGDIKAFLPALKKLVESRSESAYLIYQLAILNFHIGQFDAAIAHSKQAIALAPNWGHPYNSLANVLLKQKKVDEALKLTHEISRIKRGQDDFVLDKLATIYLYQKKNYDSAFRIADRYVQVVMRNDEINPGLIHDFILQAGKRSGPDFVNNKMYDSVNRMAKDLLYYTDVNKWAYNLWKAYGKTGNTYYHERAISLFSMLEEAALTEYFHVNMPYTLDKDYEVLDPSVYFGVLFHLYELYKVEPSKARQAEFYNMRYRMFKDTFGNGDKGARDVVVTYSNKYLEHMRSLNPKLYPEFQFFGPIFDEEEDDY
jgi:tetratricopeptide (TPR) repeat protein